MATNQQRLKAIKVLEATNALKQQGFIDEKTEQAIMTTLPIIVDTRGEVQSSNQLEAEEFADELSTLTGGFIKQSKNNANDIPDYIWDEALENETKENG